MNNNVFTAGVERGGLTDPSEIKILLCCVLLDIGEPVAKSEILDAFTEKGYANYFECADALSDLSRAGHIVETEDEQYSISDSGREIARLLGGDVPLTVRERVTENAEKLHRRAAMKRQCKTKITPQGGGYLVECGLYDSGGGEVFTVRAVTPTKLAAQNARDRFLDDAEEIVRDVYERMTGEKL